MTVVDVRNLTEWDEGHIPGARHIMLGYLDEHIDTIPREQPVVVHCQSGARSAIAASVLKASGFERVVNMAGGFNQWQAHKLPQESGAEKPVAV
jgi:hydroxyacylglutathione hydrolase